MRLSELGESLVRVIGVFMLGLSVRKPFASASGLSLAVFASALVLAFAVFAPFGVPQAFAAELEAATVVPGGADFDNPVNDLMKHSFAKPAKGSVTWDAKTKTVTMKNATINLDKQGSDEKTCAIFVSGKEVDPTPTVTLKLVGTNTITGTGKNLVAGVFVEEADLKIVGTGSLNIQMPAQSLGVYAGDNLNAASGKVTVTGSRNGIFCDDAFTLSGAKISLKNTASTALIANEDAVFKKGSLTVKGVKAGHGILVDDGFALSGATVNISGVSEKETVLVNEAAKVTAGTMTLSNGSVGISCSKSFTLNGSKAKVSINSMKSTGLVAKGVVCKAGTLSAKNCKYGIYSKSAVQITGGKVNISKASETGIYAEGGKIQITGGAASVQCASADKYALYSDKGISTKPTCLKSMKGAMTKGASFKVGGSTYQVNNGTSNVTLKAFAPSKKTSKVTVDTVTFGGWGYAVNAIGAGAFNTKQGAAVTSLTLGQRVASVDANAFSNTKKLTKMTVKRASSSKWKLNKKAFAQCGKNSGKGLTVKAASSADAKKLKRLFVKAGMSAKATFK